MSAVRRYHLVMVTSSSLARVGILGCLAVLAVAACGGKIAPSSDDIQSHSAGPYAGTGTSDVIGGPAHRPTSAPIAVPSATGASHRSATYVNGPLGFVVQDAFSFDTGPTSNRELRGRSSISCR